jgi:hypothetical protein
MKSFIFIFLTGTLMCFGQSLTVESGSSININSNSSISIDGLAFAPTSAEYTITGPNSITRSGTAIQEGSIERVYEFATALPDYTGVLTFSYLDNELNSVPETNLVLEVFDANNGWTSVVPDRDNDKNTLSYNFTALSEVSKITASNASTTLTVTTETLNDVVSVYPNPTTDRLYIVSKTTQNASLFNIAGQKLLETNSKELDVMQLPSGVYLLNLQNSQNQTSTFKIIKK